MIIQISKYSIYYPAPSDKVSGLFGLSRRMRRVRAGILVSRQTLRYGLQKGSRDKL